MLEIFWAQIDFVLLVTVCVSALALKTLWLRHSKRNSRTLLIAWLALPVLLVPGWFLVESAGDREQKRLQRRIEGLAPTYAEELSSMGHSKIKYPGDPTDPLYLAMIDKQIRWLKINKSVADIYTFRKHPDGNQLIVDSETDYDGNGKYEGKRESRTEIGEIWDEKNSSIDRAYRGTAAFDDHIYKDRWGTWVSAYVPMYDEHGKQEAVLGVDFPVADWKLAIARARRLVIVFLSIIATIGLSSASIIAVLRSNLAEREQAAKDLLVAKNAAEAATKSKSEFLANMSHEIRTPMNGVIGMTDLLGGTRLNGQQREYLRIVKQSANSLLGLLNDILDFSKIEAGKLELESIRFGLRDTIERTIQTLTFRAGEKGLEICCRIDPSVPDELIGDPGRLSQVVINLAGNAIKFTEQGEIVINVEQDSRSDDEVVLRCEVRDTGIGIAPEKLESIFTAFSQEDASTTRRFGGTGLGLAICSQLVRMMNGTIQASSEKGVGTTFQFTARFGVAADATATPESAGIHGMSVVVVDDNETNRFILEEILRGWQMHPVLVTNGPAAITELKQAADRGQPYPLALIDYTMPEMDGFDMAKIVRDDPVLKDCKLVMISSAVSPDSVEKCREFGIARYMTKPVIQSELLHAILEVTGAKPVASSPKPDDATQREPLQVLLAEDGKVNQIVAIEMLKKHGHQITLAEDGRDAYEKFQSETFDVVLMDVQMPEMDGLEATVAIRSHEQQNGSTRTPIIAMTASAMKGDRERCLDAGMDDYVSKPIEAKELHMLIDEYCPPHKTNVSRAFDSDEALSNVGGDLDTFRSMVPLFTQECSEMLRLIESGIANEDGSLIQRGAHTIKGAAAVFGASAVAQAALELEMIGKESRLDEVDPQLNLLRSLLDSLDEELCEFARSNPATT